MLVYIYGSCVSRDAFELDSAPDLAGYKARSAVGSSFGQTIDRTYLEDFDIGRNDSKFQQRMVMSDFDKSLAFELATTDFDLLLIDFIDERFNLIPMGQGVVTCSPEAIRCGLMRRAPDEIGFGSPEHLRLFRAGWERLLEVVPVDKIVVNRVYWAEKDAYDEPVESIETVARSNAILDELYTIAGASSEVRFINYSRDAFLADTEHKWGRSPFHYVPSVYEHTVRALTEIGRSRPDQLVNQISDSLAVDGNPELVLSSRRITSRSMLTFCSGNVIAAGGVRMARDVVRSSGDWSISDDVLVAEFSGEAGDYVTSIGLPPCQGNGLGARLLLEGWESIKYVAVGSIVSGDFLHVKVARPVQGSWLDIASSFDDLLYRIQNDHWEGRIGGLLHEIRVFIKGEPSSSNGRLKLRWCGVWQESSLQDRSELVAITNDKILISLRDRLWNASVNIRSDIEEFLESGVFPVPGRESLKWPLLDSVPQGLEGVGTYRYVWHSLAFAANLISYAESHGDMRAAYAGKDLITAWLENNLYSRSNDKHYAWYDHGTAERLISMLVAYASGIRLGFDKRFMLRLAAAIEMHSILLESEGFYAANQRTRFHNHAWFQDLALIGAGLAMDYGASSARWIRTGTGRMREQVAELVIRDAGFSIFAENSTGYHDAAEEILNLVGEFASGAGYGDELLTAGKEMKKWSAFFRYPSGRRPTNGDTLRFSNDSAVYVDHGEPLEHSFHVFRRAGYGVAKGSDDSKPFMLCFFATSVSDTHKHADDLSFSLEYDGVEWFIDPSFYSHEYKDEIPDYLRSPWAHNAIVIRNQSYSLRPGSSALGGMDGDDGDSSYKMRGEHTCYDGFLVKRSIVGQLNELRIDFTDEVVHLDAEGASWTAYTALHLGESVEIEQRDGYVVLRSHMTDRQVILSFGSEYEVVRGRGPSLASTSLAATDFRKVNSTATILVPHKSGSALSWCMSVAGRHEKERAGRSW